MEIESIEIYKLAKSIAQKSFVDKVDKAKKPYINHLLFVEKCIIDMFLGISEMSKDTKVLSVYKNSIFFGYITEMELRIIALLHDLLEDCKCWTKESLLCLFSKEIVDAIVALTKLSNETYYCYIDRVLKNERALIVKYFDLKHNMDITRLNEITTDDIIRLKNYLENFKRIEKEIIQIIKQPIIK